MQDFIEHITSATMNSVVIFHETTRQRSFPTETKNLFTGREFQNFYEKFSENFKIFSENFLTSITNENKEPKPSFILDQLNDKNFVFDVNSIEKFFTLFELERILFYSVQFGFISPNKIIHPYSKTLHWLTQGEKSRLKINTSPILQHHPTAASIVIIGDRSYQNLLSKRFSSPINNPENLPIETYYFKELI